MTMENIKLVNAMNVNKDKTEELIQELKNQGVIVGIEDLGSYIRKKGLVVKEHIGRKRNYIEISPKVFGVDVSQKGEEVKELFKEYMKMGKMSFIPDSYEKKLINLESSVRMTRRRESIGYDESFMTIEIYWDFVKYFEEKKREYFAIRDEIVSKWDMLIRRFKEVLLNSLDELNALDKEIIFNSIVSRVPSKEEYQRSFYMSLSVKAFPVVENLDMFDESIQKQIREGLNQETISTLYEIIGNALNDAFENVSRVLISIEKNGKLASKTLGSINKTADRLAKKNIFHNPKIDEIRRDILRVVSKSGNVEEVAELAENLLAKIYGYAKELGVESSITSISSCPLSEDELLWIYEILEPAS